MQRVRGFTLIELLVVIAIIAILAAILFPVFARAREKAKQASCTSNVKQLMLGLLMYASDYDDKFPNYLWGEGNAGNPNSVTWWGSTYPYVKNVQIFACPASGRTDRPWAVWMQRPPWNDPSVYINYGYNEIIGNTGGGLNMSRLKRPAETAVLADCSSSWIGGYWASGDRPFLRRVAMAEDPWGCGCGPQDGNYGPNPDDRARHSGGSNIGFADGHVKWFAWSRCRTVSGGGPLVYYDWEW
ncbi:MAG: DUF1559 domain-containing protein [Armatimonadota bacterium]